MREFVKGLARLIFIGLAMQMIYVVYIVAYPLISNTQAGGPAADLEILMRGHRWFAPIYTIGILLLYYLFWQAMQLVQNASRFTHDDTLSFKILILAFGLLFGFTLVWLYPITANDLFRYVLRGRIWAVYGASPMLSSPNDFPNDPYIAFAGEFGNWASGYGPLWEIVVQVPLRLGATDMVPGAISLKLVILLSFLICAILIGWFATPPEDICVNLTLGLVRSAGRVAPFGAYRDQAALGKPRSLGLDTPSASLRATQPAVASLKLTHMPPEEDPSTLRPFDGAQGGLCSGQAGSECPSLTALTFFAWNPLILMQGPGNGHNDMVFMALMVLGIVLWRRKLWWAAALAMTLAALAKATALLMIPLFGVLLLRNEPTWRQRIIKGLGAALIGLVTAYLIYSVLGPISEVLQGVSAMLTTRRGFAIASGLRMVLREIIPRDVAETLPRTTGRYIFLIFYAWLLVQLWRNKLNLVTAGFLAYFSQLMLGRTFRIWYPTWLVPLAALYLTPAAFWRTLLFGLTAELSIINYFVVWRWWLRDLPWGKFGPLSQCWNYWTIMHTLTVPWLFGIPLFGPITMRWWGGREKLPENP